jgi:nucleoid-associated protein YgaU
MAAVLSPRISTSEFETAPWNDPAARPTRPQLRLVEGGRTGHRSSGPSGARLVLVLIGGVALAGLVALAALGAVALLGADAAASGPASTAEPLPPAGADAYTPSAPAAVVVQPGDTLWAIARRLQPTGDIRPLVDELARRAGSAAVVAGQRLDLSGLPD